MGKPVTEKQANFIRKLAEERGISDEAMAFLNAGPDVKSASRYIGTLMERPVPQPEYQAVEGIDLRDVPAGHYAAEDEEGVLRFFRIDNVTKGKWEGFIFVKVQAGDELYRQGMQAPNKPYKGKSQDAIRRIMLDPRGAAQRYGQELGRCGVCGRTLTDPESIASGIGPICAERF